MIYWNDSRRRTGKAFAFTKKQRVRKDSIRNSVNSVSDIMKQKLDEVRTLAVKLFEAGQVQKRKQGAEIWAEAGHSKFRDLPSESIAVWDAIAITALKLLRK